MKSRAAYYWRDAVTGPKDRLGSIVTRPAAQPSGEATSASCAKRPSVPGAAKVHSQPFRDIHTGRSVAPGTDMKGGELAFTTPWPNGTGAQEADRMPD